MKVQGNIIRGIAIPFIIPYFDKAFSQESPDFSKQDGIKTCFNVERPDLMYEVKAIGRVIF